jgi:O-antigen/teichoic acid export membrane protein
MSDVNRVTKNTVIFIAAFGIMALLNYAFAVGLSWILDASEFGVLGVAQSLLLLGALIVGSGFAWTTSKEFAAKGQTERSRRRFRTAVLANTILGLCLALALWATYTLGWLDLGRAYQTIVPLIALTILVLAARSVVNGAAQGMYRFGAVSVNQVGEVAVKITAGLALVFLGFGVSGVMVAFALGALAALIHSVFLVRPAKLWRGRGWFDRSVLAMTAPLFLGILGPALILNLDILGLKLLSPSGQSDELAGYYQASVLFSLTSLALQFEIPLHKKKRSIPTQQ